MNKSSHRCNYAISFSQGEDSLALPLKKEPEGLAYPILLNIAGQSGTELAGGTSRINLFNASVVMDHVTWIVEKGIARVDQIGIATPYAGQITMYLDLFASLISPTTNGNCFALGPRNGGRENRRNA